ncbi:MAG TPA: Omp28-related outer membrane protein [Chitinophagaceae bacterium]|nr:Omp28-related outer membrane protein [Chitinophagaceae bacterium]
MKKLFTLMVLGAALSTQAQVTRNVLIEEYTGTWCPNCPDGHDTLKKNLQDHPGRLVIIGMHNADAYTIPYETTMENAMQVSGFPRATIDRDSFPSANYFAMSRWFWSDAIADRLNVPSPVEIKLYPSFNGTTRQLTVKVDYTFKAAVNEETRLTCVLLQDSILDSQAGATGTYVHKDVCRAVLSGNDWGDANHPASVAANSSYSKTYTYTIPTTWNAQNITVAAFINKKIGTTPVLSTGTEVLNAAEAFIGHPTATSMTDILHTQVGEVYPNPVQSLGALDFSLAKDAHVKAVITDLRGAQIKVLCDGMRTAGEHSVYWSGNNTTGVHQAPGVYLLQVEIDGQPYSRKCILE